MKSELNGLELLAQELRRIHNPNDTMIWELVDTKWRNRWFEIIETVIERVEPRRKAKIISDLKLHEPKVGRSGSKNEDMSDAA